MKRIDKVCQSKICLGCGLCQSLGTSCGYKIILGSNGFYTLQLPDELSRNESLEETMMQCCPAVSINGVGDASVWGHYVEMRNAWSTDDEIRHKASSGGFVSSVGIYLLQNGLVDGVLQVGPDENSPFLNKLKISTSIEEIKANCSSRYAPAVLLSDLKQILDVNNRKYLFVGKSCDILGLNNFLQKYPQYRDRIVCTIAIFCAGMPSYEASKKIASTFHTNKEITKYRYRGNGWPGDFTITYADNSIHSMKYEEAWMKYLGRDIHLRCKICPDSIGTIADFSVGDSWILKNGRPSFQDRPGISCVIVRNQKAAGFFNAMEIGGYINSSPLEEQYLDEIQPNHIRKRLSSPYKIAMLKIMLPHTICIRNMALLRMAMKYNLPRGFKDFIGARTRFKTWLKR